MVARKSSSNNVLPNSPNTSQWVGVNREDQGRLINLKDQFIYRNVHFEPDHECGPHCVDNFPYLEENFESKCHSIHSNRL